MFERVFTPLGITSDDLVWRDNAYREHEIDGIARREFGSGISANVDAMARLGYLYLRDGQWEDGQLLSRAFVEMARTTPRAIEGLEVLLPEMYGQASDHYGLLWWNNADATLSQVPRNTFWTWGLYESLIVVFPDLDIVVARAGESFADGSGPYSKLEPFFQPIVDAVVE